MTNIYYKNKYLKYKNKYILLSNNLSGGTIDFDQIDFDQIDLDTIDFNALNLDTVFLKVKDLIVKLINNYIILNSNIKINSDVLNTSLLLYIIETIKKNITSLNQHSESYNSIIKILTTINENLNNILIPLIQNKYTIIKKRYIRQLEEVKTKYTIFINNLIIKITETLIWRINNNTIF